MKVLIDNLKVSTKNVVEKSNEAPEYFFGKYDPSVSISLPSNSWAACHFTSNRPTRNTINTSGSITEHVINKAGRYLVSASVMVNSTTYTTAEIALLRIAVNGGITDTDFYYGDRVTTQATVNAFKHPKVTAVLDLKVGDFIRIDVIQNSGNTVVVYQGGNAEQYSYLSIMELMS